MDRAQKGRALRIRLHIAALASIGISFIFFHPIDKIVVRVARLTVGSPWYDLAHRHFWGSSATYT